jgi:hypothetical protein
MKPWQARQLEPAGRSLDDKAAVDCRGCDDRNRLGRAVVAVDGNRHTDGHHGARGDYR